MNPFYTHATVYVSHSDGFRWEISEIDEGLASIQYQDFVQGKGFVNNGESMEISTSFIDKFIEGLQLFKEISDRNAEE